ncbi:MAG: aminotransferase class I/II-fold pyridoxal phosphate-dependent enzyme [Oscillospiraceae bacterium]|jgi:aminotransferase|nr:aminotransferase class I/II-fold pyridoxal phosphate-dependent enzyme [Oscillospiraceae bacterium]
MGDRAMALTPSGIRKFFDILETMPEAISLGIGEPDFVTPWPVRDMGIYSLEKGFTKYTPNAGLSELRTEIARYMRRHYGLSYEAARQTLVTVGGSEAIDLLMRAVLNPGDEVLIPQPSFVCYGPLATLVGARPVYIETTADNEFRLTAAQLRGAITPKTRLLVLPFPNNPTGGIMTWADLEAIAEVLRGTDIMVLSDEIYAELTYGARHVSIAQIPDMYERTVVVNGFSKSHAMTGWRMGYVCGPEDVIQTMVKIHQYAIMCAPTTSQYAAIEALRNGDGHITAMREEYDTRRRFVLDRLRGMGLPCFEPLGAFYVFPDIRCTGLTSDAFCERLLREKKVATVPGEAFGDSGSGFVRCCYATSMRQLTEALDRIESFLEIIGN